MDLTMKGSSCQSARRGISTLITQSEASNTRDFFAGLLCALGVNAVPEPSGAILLPRGSSVLKVAFGTAGTRLREQARWLRFASLAGVNAVPTVLKTIDGGEIGFAYTMPRYGTLETVSTADAISLAHRMLELLEDVWTLPANDLPPLDMFGYAERVVRILAAYDPEAAARLSDAGKSLSHCVEGREPVHVHGDPTFENLATDNMGRLILLDPNPQFPPALCIPELDVAKVQQSVAGWEAFVGSCRPDLPPCSEFRSTVAQRFGDRAWPLVTWLLVTHLVRTLPYGAKVNDAMRLLPSIRAWIDYAEWG